MCFIEKYKKAISISLILVLGFCAGFFYQNYRYTGFVFADNALSNEQLQLINTAMTIIDKTAIEEHLSDDVVDYMLLGMAASLGDDYAYYFTEEELAEYNSSTAGEVKGGIGIMLELIDDRFVITDVYEGLPADSAGIKRGDEIVSVNGEKAADMEFNGLVDKVRGDAGTSVRIGVEREGKLLEYNVTRADGQHKMVTYRFLDNNIMYVRILSFNASAAELFIKAADMAEEHKCNGMVIDLRNNGGGQLDIFSKIADRILPEGEVFYAKTRTGEKIETITSNAKCLNMPLTVLINENTASASEALAGAVRDFGYGEIIGTKSFGKGIMQTTYPLTNGGAFKLTTAKYYLPKGECIHGEGITPQGDNLVELPDGLAYYMLNDQNDTQLARAIAIINNA